jgi:hypothetical protein
MYASQESRGPKSRKKDDKRKEGNTRPSWDSNMLRSYTKHHHRQIEINQLIGSAFFLTLAMTRIFLMANVNLIQIKVLFL